MCGNIIFIIFFVNFSEKQRVYETCEYPLWGIKLWKH